MSFPAYDTYKDSGNELLGSIPFGWDVWKLAHAFAQIGSGTTPKSDRSEYYDEGTIPWVNTGDLDDGPLADCAKKITVKAVEDHTTLKLYPEGSLLFAMYGATIGKLGLLEFPATVNQASCVFSGESPINKEFLFYWFLGLRQRILSLATGGGQPNVSQDILRTLRVACPDEDEQKMISSFLDVETSKIDGLVSEQRRLIELLKEKRQAVISHAVTKGLNPNAPMKPSGIQWLGDVPQHWEVKPVRYACDIHNTLRTPIDKQSRSDIEGDYPYYGPTGILSWINKFVVEGEYFLVGEDGDHFLKFRTQPMTVNVAGQFNVNNHAHLISGKDNCSTNWASLYFEHKDLMPWLIKQGVGRYKLRKEKLVTIPILVPPPSEQGVILAEADRVKKTTVSLIAEAERAIELLQERRTALISAAVTGKIDVRELAHCERQGASRRFPSATRTKASQP